MKKLFFIMFCILGIVSYSQYTEVPDINFETYLENMGYGDGIQGNGLVLTDEVDDVMVLNVSSMQISDLTGIEDFASLERLSCIYNSLTELDVSHNQNLKILGCYANQLTSLTLNNPELEELYAFENFLTEIDVSGSPLLEYLDVDNNRIQNLDVSQNHLLSVLNCSGNFLSELDLWENTEIISLRCGYNNLITLDFSNNPNLLSISTAFNPYLEFFDMRNGNNEAIGTFNSYGTNDLQCILVDDASADYLEDWSTDTFTHFVNNEQECDDLDVENTFNQELIFYPNPVKNKFTIENPDLKIISIKVSDASGKLIINQVISTKQTQIDFIHLPSGIYFVSFEENGKILKTEKVIKK